MTTPYSLKRNIPLGIVLLALASSHLARSEETVSVLGYLEPYRSISMNAAESGVIAEIKVREGDPVKEGQHLLNLEIAVLEAQLAIARVQARSTASVELAEADLSVARDRHSKLTELKASGTAHTTELARAEADLKKAVAQLDIAREESKIAAFRVAEIEAGIEQRTLRSPIDGVVVEINREIAESATAPQEGQQNKPLLKLAQVDRLRLQIHAPAEPAARLAVGQKLGIRILGSDSLARDPASGGTETEGTIEFVSPTIDPATGTVRIRLVIENRDGGLKSGAHAHVLLKAPAAAREP